MTVTNYGRRRCNDDERHVNAATNYADACVCVCDVM